MISTIFIEQFAGRQACLTPFRTFAHRAHYARCTRCASFAYRVRRAFPLRSSAAIVRLGSAERFIDFSLNSSTVNVLPAR